MRGGVAAVTPSHPRHAAGAPLQGGISDRRHGRRRGQLSRHQLSHGLGHPWASHNHHPGIRAAINISQTSGKKLLKNSTLVGFCSRGAGSRHSSLERRAFWLLWCFSIKKEQKSPSSVCCSHFMHLPKSSPQVSHHIVAQLLSKRRLGQS